jgi:hypothetical protein
MSKKGTTRRIEDKIESYKGEPIETNPKNSKED